MLLGYMFRLFMDASRKLLFQFCMGILPFIFFTLRVSKLKSTRGVFHTNRILEREMGKARWKRACRENVSA